MPCMGRPARPPPPAPPPPLASLHLNLRGLVFNFIKKIALGALSYFLLRIFFSWTKSFIDIDGTRSQNTVKCYSGFTAETSNVRIPIIFDIYSMAYFLLQILVELLFLGQQLVYWSNNPQPSFIHKNCETKPFLLPQVTNKSFKIIIKKRSRKKEVSRWIQYRSNREKIFGNI